MARSSELSPNWIYNPNFTFFPFKKIWSGAHPVLAFADSPSLSTQLFIEDSFQGLLKEVCEQTRKEHVSPLIPDALVPPPPPFSILLIHFFKRTCWEWTFLCPPILYPAWARRRQWGFRDPDLITVLEGTKWSRDFMIRTSLAESSAASLF